METLYISKIVKCLPGLLQCLHEISKVILLIASYEDIIWARHEATDFTH